MMVFGWATCCYQKRICSPYFKPLIAIDHQLPFTLWGSWWILWLASYSIVYISNGIPQKTERLLLLLGCVKVPEKSNLKDICLKAYALYLKAASSLTFKGGRRLAWCWSKSPCSYSWVMSLYRDIDVSPGAKLYPEPHRLKDTVVPLSALYFSF